MVPPRTSVFSFSARLWGLHSEPGRKSFPQATVGEKKAKCQLSFFYFSSLCALNSHGHCCTFSPMPNLTLSVRIAAGSILFLSVMHILFWAVLAITAHSAAPATYPANLLFPVSRVFSVAGLVGVFVGVGIFRVRPWARVAALVVAAIVLLFCGFGILVLALTLVGLFGLGLGVEIPTISKTYFTGMGLA